MVAGLTRVCNTSSHEYPASLLFEEQQRFLPSWKFIQFFLPFLFFFFNIYTYIAKRSISNFIGTRFFLRTATISFSWKFIQFFFSFLFFFFNIYIYMHIVKRSISNFIGTFEEQFQQRFFSFPLRNLSNYSFFFFSFLFFQYIYAYCKEIDF